MKYFVVLAFAFLSFSIQADPLHIMLTNDDGIDAHGLKAVHASLTRAGHRVSVVAPAKQQSGSGSSLGHLLSETPFEDRGNNQWAVHGSPAGAVFLGLGLFLENDPPDLVVAGANFGQNVGTGVNYSGTVGAALTAFKIGVPVIAISVEFLMSEAASEPRFASTFAAFPDAGDYVADLIEDLDGDFNDGAFININYPARAKADIQGTRLTFLSEVSLIEGFEVSSPGIAKPLMKYRGNHDEMSDAGSIAAGYVSISFLDDSIAADKRASRRMAKKLRKVIK